MAEASNLLVQLTADDSGLRSTLANAERITKSATTSISQAFDRVQVAAQNSTRSVRQIGGAVTTLAGEAGGAVGNITRLGSTLVSSLAGGPITLGLTAAGLAVTSLVAKYNEAATASEEAAERQKKANEEVKQSIDKIVLSMAAQAKAKQLQVFGSNESTATMLDQLEAENAKVEEAERVVRRARTEWERWYKLKKESPGSKSAEIEEERAAKALLKAEVARNEIKAERNKFKTEKFDAFTQSQMDVEAYDDILNEQAKLNKPATKKTKAPSTSALHQAELAQYDVLIQRAQLLGDKEEEIKQKRLKALAALKQQTNLDPASRKLAAENIDLEAKQAKEKLDKETADKAKKTQRELTDFEMTEAARRASITKTKVDDLEAAQAQELEAVKRKVEDEIVTEEEGQKRIAAIRDRYKVSIASAIDQEAKAHQDEMAKKILNEQQITGHAMQVGFSAASALAQGFKQAAKDGDAAGIMRGIFGAAGLVASFFGPVGLGVGAGLNFMGGMFADGGLITQGTHGTADDVLLWGSKGEFVQRQSAVQKFGVRFMERLNDGYLDLSALPKRASGGLVGADSPGSPSSVAGIGGTNVYVSAFDPVTTAQMLGQILEPEQYRRGMTRADAKQISGLRRRIEAPRSGRRN